MPQPKQYNHPRGARVDTFPKGWLYAGTAALVLLFLHGGLQIPAIGPSASFGRTGTQPHGQRTVLMAIASAVRNELGIPPSRSSQ